MQHDPDDTSGRDPESDDLVARARAAVLEMRRQAAAGGLDAAEEAAPADKPVRKSRRRKKGAADRAA